MSLDLPITTRYSGGMTSDPRSEFEDRVAFMSIALNQHEPLDGASPVVDQVLASSDEVRRKFEAAAPIMAEMIDGEVKTWEPDVAPEVAAFLLAAVSGDEMTYCPHVNAPTPTIVSLAHQRTACHDCARRLPRNHPGLYDDLCDFCRRWGVTEFYPVVTVFGPMTIAGDACSDCVERMRI